MPGVRDRVPFWSAIRSHRGTRASTDRDSLQATAPAAAGSLGVLSKDTEGLSSPGSGGSSHAFLPDVRFATIRAQVGPVEGARRGRDGAAGATDRAGFLF